MTAWNPSDQTNVTLSGGNLTASATTNNGGVRSAHSLTAGKYYWEYTIGRMSAANTGLGVCNASAILSSVGSTVANACEVYSTGNVWLAAGSQATIGSLVAGDVVCIALDAGGKLIWFRKGASGLWHNNASHNPATGVGGVNVSSIAGTGYFAMFAFTTYTPPPQAVTANFGDSAFVGTVPSGFTAGFPPAAASAVTRQYAVSVILS